MTEEIHKDHSYRLLSLDLFRGWTIIAMIIVNNPGDWCCVFSPLEHAAWNGWTPTDLIFPFFLWISGFAIPLSSGRKTFESKAKLQTIIVRRSLLLIVFGLFLSGFPFGLIGSHTFSVATWRLPGVLQRIGICYLLCASLFLYGGARVTAVTSLLFLALYGAVLHYFPVPNVGPGNLSPDGNAARFIDSYLIGLNHTWRHSPASGFDPEGILSTLTATVTMQTGVLSYRLFLFVRKSGGLQPFWMVGLFLVAAGRLFDVVEPINKNLWTISYVLLTTGIAMLCFASLYFLYDVKGAKRLAFLPDLFGKNAIVVYVASGLLARILIYARTGNASWKQYLFETLFRRFIDFPALASFVFAIVFLLCFVPFMWILKRKKLYLRL